MSLAAIVPLTNRVFDHNIWLFVSLLAAIVIYAATYIGRGTFSGNGRFRAYGVMLGSEGTVRVIATVVLVVVGCRTPAPVRVGVRAARRGCALHLVAR